jgi:hypothetical protein
MRLDSREGQGELRFIENIDDDRRSEDQGGQLLDKFDGSRHSFR